MYSCSTHLHDVKDGERLAVETCYRTGTRVVYVSTTGIIDVHT